MRKPLTVSARRDAEGVMRHREIRLHRGTISATSAYAAPRLVTIVLAPSGCWGESAVRSGVGRPGRRPTTPSATYRRGSVLTKVWQGEHHRVEVLEAGFLWNGEHHASLSSIARKITGVRWNGPRFFGLREGQG